MNQNTFQFLFIVSDKSYQDAIRYAEAMTFNSYLLFLFTVGIALQGA